MGMSTGISYPMVTSRVDSIEASSLWHDPQYSKHLANGHGRREDVSQKASYIGRNFLELQEENIGITERKGRPCHVFN